MGRKYAHNVLIAPLDWGLGHTTRCIPIIKQLLQLHCNVFVACEGASKKLLEQEFNNLNFLPLKGYRVRYSRLKRALPFKILQQLPKILLTISYENRWLKAAVATYKINLVISDNRYGLTIKNTPCIFITHQLQILAPNSVIQRLMQKIAYRYINKFTACWVPDFEGELNISGKLSHPQHLPKTPIFYIGPLARFKKITTELQYKWLVLLSGPEPQRTLLEQKLIPIFPKLNGNILFIRGLPQNFEQIKTSENCTVFNHLNTQQLEIALGASEFVVSRSGYTTVMEILTLQKKSILIPTPGQTEQEYLAKHLYNQNWAYTFKQDDPDILTQLINAETFNYQLPQMPYSNALQQVLEQTLQDITL